MIAAIVVRTHLRQQHDLHLWRFCILTRPKVAVLHTYTAKGDVYSVGAPIQRIRRGSEPFDRWKQTQVVKSRGSGGNQRTYLSLRSPSMPA